ncbi:MAG: DUF58 domain-containing protein [Proteobacteria bacterium]|nr:DUF58 domain-containing protein [Pseudomonadota bacterium]
MTLKDYLKKLKKIEFHTRMKTQEGLSGTYHSAFKGRGMLFSECKAYEEGDDVRYIDWNASARHNGLFVKQFVEERELNVCVVLDLSTTMQFGSVGMNKAEKAIEAMSIVAFSALQNNDKVSLFIFNDKGMKYIPPVKGKNNIVYLILEALRFEPEQGNHQLGEVMGKVLALMKRRALVFVISDFIEFDYELSIRHLAHHHEVIPIVVSDPLESTMPDLGFTLLEDASTHEYMLVDTSRAEFREYYREQFEKRRAEQKKIFDRAGLTHVRILTTDEIIKPIARAFERRAWHV